jgi:hypothetical protein
MKKLLVTKLSDILNACIVGSPVEEHILAFSTDSRTVKPGDCFFAISGENFDGHNFLGDAFAKGASCAVVSQDIPADKFPGKAILKVSDTIKALGDLAAWYRKDCKFKVVAITGSVGKTTTRQIIYHVLSQRFKTHQPVKNFNNFIGLPLSILSAPPDSQILILELAIFSLTGSVSASFSGNYVLWAGKTLNGDLFVTSGSVTLEQDSHVTGTIVLTSGELHIGRNAKVGEPVTELKDPRVSCFSRFG